MNHKFILIALLILAVFALSACTSVFVPVGTSIPAPTPIIQPTNPPPLPTQPVPPAPTTIQSAPMCTTDPLATACTAPVAEERDKFCVKKVPYALIALPPGSTFQPAEAGLMCTDEGIRDGLQMVSCTGQRLYSYKLKVCNSACAAAAPLAAGSNQCPSGYGYNAGASCCWPMPAPDAGCTLVKIDIGTCY